MKTTPFPCRKYNFSPKPECLINYSNKSKISKICSSRRSRKVTFFSKVELTAAKEKTLEEKKALGEENIRKTLEDLYRRTSNDEDSEEIDAGQLAVYKLAKIYFDEGAFDKSTDLLLQL